MAKKSSRQKRTDDAGAARMRSPIEEAAFAVAERYGNRPAELMEILHELQHQLRCIPDEALPALALALNLSRAEVYGVVSFYHDFRREPGGRHTIKICRAEACQSMGTEKLCAHATARLKTPLGGTTDDGKITLEHVFCLGNCALSPAVMVDDRLYGRVDADRFDAIVESLEKEAAE